MIYNSDYPQLYIAGTFSTSVRLTDVGWGVFNGAATVPYNLPFKPLIRAMWSDRADYLWANDLGVYAKNRFGNYPEIALDTYLARDSDLLFQFVGSYSVQVYLKGVLIAPPTYTGEVREFDTIGNFKFNSDRRYNKLFMSGELPVGGGTVDHGLGYVPNCWVFEKGPYGRVAINKVQVTESQLIVRTPSGASDAGFYYFIFKDKM